MIRANFIIGLELEFDVVLNSTSIKMTLCCISPNHSILPCHDHASYCALHWLISSLLPVFVPPGRRCSGVVIVDTNEDSMLSSEVPGKQTPLFIPIQSHSLAPALFYCIRTTTVQMLHVAVVEPLSFAWPVIAKVNRWNPLAWVGVVWALMCLLIHACSHACYCLELSQVWFIGDESEACEHVLLCVS